MASQGASSAARAARAGVARAGRAHGARVRATSAEPVRARAARDEKGVGGPPSATAADTRAGPAMNSSSVAIASRLNAAARSRSAVRRGGDRRPQGCRQRRRTCPGDRDGDPGHRDRRRDGQQHQAGRADGTRDRQDPVAPPVRQTCGDRAAGHGRQAEHRDRDPGRGEAARPLAEQEQDRQRHHRLRRARDEGPAKAHRTGRTDHTGSYRRHPGRARRRGLVSHLRVRLAGSCCGKPRMAQPDRPGIGRRLLPRPLDVLPGDSLDREPPLPELAGGHHGRARVHGDRCRHCAGSSGSRSRKAVKSSRSRRAVTLHGRRPGLLIRPGPRPGGVSNSSATRRHGRSRPSARGSATLTTIPWPARMPR